MRMMARLLKERRAWQRQIDHSTMEEDISPEYRKAFYVRYAHEFDWDRAAENLLSWKARVEYKERVSPALIEYYEKTAEAWAEFKKKMILAEYTTNSVDARVVAELAAETEFNKKTAPAGAELREKKAAAFFKASHRRKNIYENCVETIYEIWRQIARSVKDRRRQRAIERAFNTPSWAFKALRRAFKAPRKGARWERDEIHVKTTKSGNGEKGAL